MAPTAKPATRKRSGGRFAEINGFVDCTLAKLTPSAVAVWLILWRDTKPNGLARTGQADLARRAGVTERAVRKALVELIAAKLLKVVRRGRVGSDASAVSKNRGPKAFRKTALRPAPVRVLKSE